MDHNTFELFDTVTGHHPKYATYKLHRTQRVSVCCRRIRCEVKHVLQKHLLHGRQQWNQTLNDCVSQFDDALRLVTRHLSSRAGSSSTRYDSTHMRCAMVLGLVG